MAEYHGLAVTTLRQAGRRIDDEVLTHIWPSHHENVHFYGTHTVDIAAELATLDTNGYTGHCACRAPRSPGERPRR